MVRETDTQIPSVAVSDLHVVMNEFGQGPGRECQNDFQRIVTSLKLLCGPSVIWPDLSMVMQSFTPFLSASLKMISHAPGYSEWCSAFSAVLPPRLPNYI